MCIAAAIVGGSVVGAVATSNAASKAGKSQQAAADKASQTELDQFYQNREDMAPWREAGEAALEQMVAGGKAGGEFNREFTLADFTKDPGYEFRRQEGQRGVEAGAAARGGVLSGAALKGVTRYNQDYSSGEYQNAYNRFNNDKTQRFNRLASVAGVGQTATRDVAQQGAQTASNVAQNQIGAGNAQASSYVGQGNAISGAAKTLGNFAMSNYYMNSMPAVPSYGAPTVGGWGSTGSTYA